MGIIESITKAIDFLENLFNRKYGIRTLYFLLLLIPGLSLAFLYYMSLNENKQLREELAHQKILNIECIAEKNKLKDSVRAEVMTELKSTLELINNFKTVISKDNAELKREADKINTQLNTTN